MEKRELALISSTIVNKIYISMVTKKKKKKKKKKNANKKIFEKKSVCNTQQCNINSHSNIFFGGFRASF